MIDTNKPVKVYITKYALTKGIEEEEHCIKKSNTLNEYYVSILNGYKLYIIGIDAFLTLEEAQSKAEQMRLKKIASLKKQIDKLEKIKF